MKKIITSSALASSLLLGACVTPTTQMPTVAAADAASEAQKQSALAVKMRLEDQARVAAVADRLFIANADLCPDATRGIGVQTVTLSALDPKFRTAASASLGLSDAPQVDWVAPSGPAEVAGLKPGDVILSVNGQEIEAKPSGVEHVRTALASGSAADVPIKYRRAGQVVEVIVHPVKMCGYAVAVLDTDVVNAAADGKHIAVNRGMLRFVKSDDELALVMAHELAHDAERHIRAKSANAAMGMAGGAAVDLLLAFGGVNTGGAFMKAGHNAGMGYASAEFEGEADYVGMYYMARAGYDVNGVEDFWRRMAVDEPSAIFVKTDHPTTPARYLAIGKTRDEILAKRKVGAPLLPERKAAHKAAPAPETVSVAKAAS